MSKVKTGTRRTSVDLSKDVFEALERIRLHYDLKTMADAIRKAALISDDVVQSGSETVRVEQDGTVVRTRYL